MSLSIPFQAIVCATSNPGKLRELRHLFRHLPLHFVSQADCEIEEVEETAETFLENALLKARAAAKQSRLPALADDSGLCVAALQGRPGVYSARFSKEGSSESNNQKLLADMQGLEGQQRSAFFCCTLVFLEHEEDPMPLVFQGLWRGEIIDAPRGEGGFGYDPLFYLPALQKTAAELPLDLKNSLSHRAHAVKKFLRYWEARP